VIVDTFMFNNELDMLECRLTEIADAVDHVIAVEADVDHQDHPKPYHLTENLGRFEQWKDKLIVVRATGLPTALRFPDPWARERAQREHTRTGFEQIGGVPSDCVVLHGDVDEIPRTLAARNVRPKGFVAFEQTGHFWSLRWRYPHTWQGTVAARAGDVTSFTAMRDRRNITPVRLPNAGWHLSWLPNGDDVMASAKTKVGSFCHPEVRDRIVEGLHRNQFLHDGIHVDGEMMIRCEIDRTFPQWIREGRHPKAWEL
jgi:hypothetical protein